MFQVFFGIGTGMVYAASSQPTTADGYHPVASVPTGVNYCYPSGYNRQGWRCGWRLAMARITWAVTTVDITEVTMALWL